MRLHDPTNFRRLIRHRCQYCGRDFFTDKRTGRPRLFCDKKCKDGEFRRLRYLTFKNVETPQKSEVSSKVSKVDLGDRPSALIGPTDWPVNILGGDRWSNSVALETLAEIIATEIDGFESGETDIPVVASDWKPCTPSSPITDDLSIPAFLRRVRS
jgi:hypothetical protein